MKSVTKHAHARMAVARITQRMRHMAHMYTCTLRGHFGQGGFCFFFRPPWESLQKSPPRSEGWIRVLCALAGFLPLLVGCATLIPRYFSERWATDLDDYPRCAFPKKEDMRTRDGERVRARARKRCPQQPRGEVSRQAKFFQPTQPIPKPICDRSGQPDNKHEHDITPCVIRAQTNLSGEIRVEQTHDRSGQLDKYEIALRAAPELHREITTLNTDSELIRERIEEDMDFKIPGLPHSTVKHAQSASVQEMIQKIEPPEQTCSSTRPTTESVI